MISCKEVQDCIADYSVGALSAGRSVVVDEHLKDCAACAKELRLLEGAMALVESVDQVEPPAGIWSAVAERISAPERTTSKSFYEKLREMLAPPQRVLAAGFAVLVILIMMTFNHINAPTDPVIADAETSEYVQGHVIFASQDAFADRVGLGSVTGAAMVDEGRQTP